MKKVVILLLLMALSGVLPAQRKCSTGVYIHGGITETVLSDNAPWVLVFEEEFEGNSLDRSTWTPVNGIARDYGFTKQKAWYQQENIVIEDGMMKLMSRYEPKKNMEYIDNWGVGERRQENFDYTTGEIISRDMFHYGKLEAEIKIPKGKGYWPAFWMYSHPWNEIDVFEVFATETNVLRTNIHHDYYGTGGRYQCIYKHKAEIDFSEDFHIYTLIWDRDMMSWYVDGQLIRTAFRYYQWKTKEPVSVLVPGVKYEENRSFPTAPMDIRFNTAILSKKKDKPDKTTPASSQMEVKWVRYYQRATEVEE